MDIRYILVYKVMLRCSFFNIRKYYDQLEFKIKSCGCCFDIIVDLEGSKTIRITTKNPRTYKLLGYLFRTMITL